ncbi:MAG: helicase-related protein, partial [Acidimicrobiales bacterium]
RVARSEVRLAEARRRAEEREIARKREAEERATEHRQTVLALNDQRSAVGLNRTEEARDWLFTAEVATALQISEDQVRRAGDHGDLAFTSIDRPRRGTYRRYDLDLVVHLAAEPPPWLTAVRSRRESRLTAKRERREQADGAVTAGMPIRQVAPERVVAHLGPTNSGKTHDALAALAAAGRGAYAAPLRMLAYEAYERLTALLGEGAVGLVTGEERINDPAPILCCTAEMAPMRGDLLVLDEVQWAADPERGWAWTRLLAGAAYREIRLAGAPDALPLVQAAFPGAEVVLHDRLCPLQVADRPFTVESVPDKAVVVAFSRKAVMHLAGLLSGSGRAVAVLYGAMPPDLRRHEIGRFVDGDAQVMVATDVIGHGINLPVSHVIFAETQKFDGVSRRSLVPAEAAQIAGRAGRYGYEPVGTVGWLQGVPGFQADSAIVAKVSRPTVDVGNGVWGFSRVTRGKLGPSLDQLGAARAEDLDRHLEAWGRAARSFAKDHPWVEVASIDPLRARLAVVSRAVRLARLDVETAWRLARAPFDATNDDAWALARCAQALVDAVSLRDLVYQGRLARVDLEEAERLGRMASGLRWFTLAFPGAGAIDYEDARSFEVACSERAAQLLDKAVRKGIRRCVTCGAVCAPWFSECDSCHNEYRWDHDDYGDYGDTWIPPRKSRRQSEPKKADPAVQAAKREREEAKKAHTEALDAEIALVAAGDP